MSRPTVRLDLSDLDGYHSPQLTVAVRLNTNEAPDPPPEAFTAAVQAALSGLQWHRYPDRAATELRFEEAASLRDKLRAFEELELRR